MIKEQDSPEITPREWEFAGVMWQSTKELMEKGDLSGTLIWNIIERHYPGNKERQTRVLGFINDFLTEQKKRHPEGVPSDVLLELARKWDVERAVVTEALRFLPSSDSELRRLRMPREPLFPHVPKKREPLFPHTPKSQLEKSQDYKPIPPTNPGKLEELLQNRDKMNRWLESKRLSITAKERLTTEQAEHRAPFKLCAIKMKKPYKRPYGPLSEMKPEHYEIIECRETTSWFQTEPELFTMLFRKHGEVTIKDVIPAEDASRETLKRLTRRCKQSTDEHIAARKEELEEFLHMIEDAISTLEEQGRDTSSLEERRDAVENALDFLEKGNLKDAIGELEFVD